MQDNKSKKAQEEVFTCRHCGNRTLHTLLKYHLIKVDISSFEGEAVYADDWVESHKGTKCAIRD
jgi:hypothetical protein